MTNVEQVSWLAAFGAVVLIVIGALFVLGLILFVVQTIDTWKELERLRTKFFDLRDEVRAANSATNHRLFNLENPEEAARQKARADEQAQMQAQAYAQAEQDRMNAAMGRSLGTGLFGARY